VKTIGTKNSLKLGTRVLIYKPIRRKGRSEKLLLAGTIYTANNCSELRRTITSREKEVQYRPCRKHETLHSDELILESDESAKQCENRPDPSSENMGKELKKQVEPIAITGNEDINITTTPVLYPFHSIATFHGL
jgi:hypothetical protein